MMIAKITAACTRYYSDNGQVTTYVEWVDDEGETGRLGPPMGSKAPRPAHGIQGAHVEPAPAGACIRLYADRLRGTGGSIAFAPCRISTKENRKFKTLPYAH